MIPLDFIMKTIRRIFSNDHLFSYDSMLRTCSEVERIMKEIELSEIQTIHFPADGKIAHGGWVMPAAWTPKSATLEVILPDGTRKELCSYPDIPCSLMLYSTSCNVTGKMVLFDSEDDVKDKFVLGGNHFFSIQESEALYKEDAKVILSGKLLGPFSGMEGYEYLRDVCQWCNYGLPFWKENSSRAGFSLTPNQSEYLQKLLKTNGEVTLHAVIDASLKDGTIPLVTGLLPGETNEEIVVTGHLFEQGADDNASGCAMALALVKELAKKKRKRGIRLMFTHEIKSLQAYLNTNPQLPKIVAGIDLDMVGVTTDNYVNIGDSTPIFPNYAPALLKHLLEPHGFKAIISEITSMDTQFSDPEYHVPMSFMVLFSNPNYHKSSDTPDTISAEVLKRTYQVSLRYVEFLVNAGFNEAKQLIDIVFAYEKERAEILPDRNRALRTGHAAPKFAHQIAKERLDSILTLVDVEKREMFRRLLEEKAHEIGNLFQFIDPIPRPALTIEQKNLLETLIPVKKFHGTLSFEKNMMEATLYPRVKDLINGWSVVPWLDYAVMWSNGARNGAEIWEMLSLSGNPADPELFYEIMKFMAEKDYISLK